MKKDETKKVVKKAYANIAKTAGNCRCSCSDEEFSAEKISKAIGYSDEEMNAVPEANMGLGCGNPTALGKIKEGDVVLDLGSGAGFDAFLASKKVGDQGKVIGVDMTEDMIAKANALAKKHDYKNVEFRLGDIEKLPVDDDSIDIIISNCVINLAPDKDKVFKDAHRVLNKGGRMYISDIVLLQELTAEQKKDVDLITGCVAGALLKDVYVGKLEKAGFRVEILEEDDAISKEQYNNIPLESLKFVAKKK